MNRRVAEKQGREHMHTPDIRKHIIGYILGGLVFLVLIPFIIYQTSLILPDSLGSAIYPIKYIQYSVALVLASAGVVFVIWSNIDLLIIGKGGPSDVFNIPVSPRSKKLVTSGPYRYTRNPMVFGTNTVYIAFSLFLNSISALFFCLLFLSVIILYLEQTEEKRLFKDFGDEYLEYKRRVSMVIPFPFRKNR